MQRFTRLVLGIGFCVCLTSAPIASAQTVSSSYSPLPTAAELSDRCAKASGGAAWSRLSTMVLNGTMKFPLRTSRAKSSCMRRRQTARCASLRSPIGNM